MSDFLSHTPKPECVARVHDIDRQAKNRADEIVGLMKRYDNDYAVLAVLEAAARYNNNAASKEVAAAYQEDYHVREGMSDDTKDLVRAQVVEPEINLANLYRKTRDSLLGSVLDIEDEVHKAITPRRI